MKNENFSFEKELSSDMFSNTELLVSNSYT